MTTPPTAAALDELERKAFDDLDRTDWRKPLSDDGVDFVRRRVEAFWREPITPRLELERVPMTFVSALLARLDEAERQREWQPIETAPRDGTPVLTFWPTLYGLERHSVRAWRRGDWPSASEGWADAWMQIKPHDRPTHWMALPDPPALSAHPPAAGEVG